MTNFLSSKKTRKHKIQEMATRELQREQRNRMETILTLVVGVSSGGISATR